VYARPGSQRLVTSVCLALLVAACGGGGDGPTVPGHTTTNRNAPGVHAILGADITDTIDAQPLQALVVEVRDTSGKLVSGATVRFVAEPSADTTPPNNVAVSMCPLSQPACARTPPTGLIQPPAPVGLSVISNTTDGQGRASVAVKLGHVAGRAVIRLTVPDLALEDSATYTVLPGAASYVRALCADTALAIGATATLRGRVVDRYGNSRSEVPVVTASTGNTIALNASTGVVTAREMGTQWLFMRYLQIPADSTMVRVLPAGRLVAWSPSERAVRLVNVDGSATRTLVTGVASNLGAFPHFDGLRKNITLHNGSAADGGVPNSVIVIDTTGSPRRDLGPGVGFATVVATRQLADGTLLVVGNTVADTSCAGLALFRVASDNSLTCLTTLPGLSAEYGAADISHDGTRVAYIGSDASIPNSSSFELRILNVATGAKTVLEPVATSPRWSSGDDRVAYLVPRPGAYVFGAIDGTAMIISADGTGRRSLGNFVFSPGLAWSPDGTYIVGRNSGSPDIALRVIRISDGANVLLRFRTTAGATADYYQPDWR